MAAAPLAFSHYLLPESLLNRNDRGWTPDTISMPSLCQSLRYASLTKELKMPYFSQTMEGPSRSVLCPQDWAAGLSRASQARLMYHITLHLRTFKLGDLPSGNYSGKGHCKVLITK